MLIDVTQISVCMQKKCTFLVHGKHLLNNDWKETKVND